MNPVNIVLWKWKDGDWPEHYDAQKVNLIAHQLTKNLKIPHNIFCITDNSAGIDKTIGIIKLWKEFAELGHCYRRLRSFSSEMKNIVGDYFFSVDLDTVITGDVTDIFSRQDDFIIAKDTQPGTPYNGSFFGMKSGAREQVYLQFKREPSSYINAAKAMGYAACDQAIMALILGTDEKTLSQKDGLYSFKNDLRGSETAKVKLPKNSKMVFFHGNPKPWNKNVLENNTWVSESLKMPKRRLLVLGGAKCVWDDLKTVDASSFDVMAVNDMGYDYPGRIDYWATLHPENLEGWLNKRKEKGGNQDFETWAHCDIPATRVDNVLEGYWRGDEGISGSSGLFAVQAGLHMGYDEIILAGVPMDGQDNQTGKKDCWNDNVAQNFRLAWVKYASELRGRVISLSGWTKELLSPFAAK